MLGKARLATADLRLSPYKRQRPEIRRVRTFVLYVCIFLVFRCHARAGLTGGELDACCAVQFVGASAC